MLLICQYMRLGRVRWLSKKTGMVTICARASSLNHVLMISTCRTVTAHSPSWLVLVFYSWIWLVNIEQLTPHLWAHTRMNLGQEYVTMEIKWWCHKKHGYRGAMNIKEWTLYNRRLMEYFWGMREVHYIGGCSVIISMFTLIPWLTLFF